LARLLAVAIAIVALGGPSLASDQQGVSGSENDLKAALIYNFAKFVEWPAGALSGNSLTIDVIDDQPLVEALTRIVQRKQVHQRAVVVHARDHGRGRGQPEGDIAVIGSLEDSAVAWELERIGHRPVLTVGDSPRLLQLGGMIRYTVANDRLQFEINPEAAARSGLLLSAQLVELSRNGRRSK
jgi:hypothetical protein